jgi:hypothetical protein
MMNLRVYESFTSFGRCRICEKFSNLKKPTLCLIKGDIPLPQGELEHHILKEIKMIQRSMASDKEGLWRISEWREKQLSARDCARV